jgi:hypothetical protein
MLVPLEGKMKEISFSELPAPFLRGINLPKELVLSIS